MNPDEQYLEQKKKEWGGDVYYVYVVIESDEDGTRVCDVFFNEEDAKNEVAERNGPYDTMIVSYQKAVLHSDIMTYKEVEQ